MSDKLSDKFLESFAKRASSLFESRNVSAKSEVESLQEQIQVVDRKINAARIGGAGHLGKLVEQKSLLQFQLQEAKANVPVEVKLEEQKTPYIVVDTADDNKVVGMASDERNAKMTISSAERPPMSIKDKSTLKIVKSNKKQNIGMPLKEDTEITELHTSLLEAHGIEKKVAEKVKKVFDGMSDAEKAAFMKSYLKNPKAAMDYMFADMKKMAKEEIEEALDPVNPVAVKKKFDDRKDKDLDNDGDTDSSDEYLHKRRKAISKALAKEEVEIDESRVKAVGGQRSAKMGKAMDPKDKKIPKRGTKAYDKWVADAKARHASSWEKWKTEEVEVKEAMSAKERALAKAADEAKSKDKVSLKKAPWDMKKEEVELDEAKNDYTINHKTFSSAVQHAKSQVEKQGYSIDDDEWDRKVAMGPRRPGRGKTNRYTIELMKDGKPTKRMLQMQVYYDEGRYELNMYVS